MRRSAAWTYLWKRPFPPLLAGIKAVPESLPPDSAIIPTLPSRNLNETRAFYGALGFKPIASEDRDGYLVLGFGPAELHFFAAADLDPASSVSGCCIRVADADRVHGRFATAGLPATGTPRLTALADRPWGQREFTLVDPDGNLIRVCAPLR
jgi:catechol 2,3-dioxygenase-like lactoylglutathione lyase family enzyme